MTITLTREEAQQVLDALEKLANETPTTHVRVGRAISDGKEHVALWFDDSTDPLQQALYLNATKPEKLKPLLTFFRARLSAPEPEPVAGYRWEEGRIPPSVTFTAPSQREWQGLTDEDLSVCDEDGVILARYWEAKLQEKNT
jgi:hypothetical protein